MSAESIAQSLLILLKTLCLSDVHVASYRSKFRSNTIDGNILVCFPFAENREPVLCTYRTPSIKVSKLHH